MAFRTVAVDLVAKVANYKRELASAGRSTKDFKQELNEAAKAGEATATANETLARSARKAGEESKKTGEKAKKASDGLEKFGYSAKILDKQIVVLRADLAKMANEFDRTGDVDLLRRIKVQKKDFDDVVRLRKEITGLVSGALGAGISGGSRVGEELTKSLMALRGPAIAGAIGIGAVMAPVIGAAISSAVIGVTGGVGLIGGIVAASQDQRVQDAAKQVGNRIGDSLVEASASFVGPIIESLNVLDNAGDRLADNLEKAGSKIAPVLPVLAGGIAGFADAVGPGFIRAMDAAKPVIRALSRELPKIGDAVSDMFDKLSDDPDQAVMGIVAISQAIQGTIDVAGDLLDTLGDIFEWSSRSGAAMSETWESLFGWMPIAGDHIENVGAGFREQVAAIDAARNAAGDYTGELGGIIRAEEDMAEATKTATQKIEDQITAMDKMFGRFADSREVARNYQEAIDDLTESVKEHGTSLDIGTEAGRSNSAALDNLAQKIKDARENTILMTGDVAGANTVYYEQVEALRQQAIKLGLSKQEANNLANELRDIPRQVDVEIRAPGLLEALARARELNRLMGSISAGARARAGDDSGYGGGRAGGGPMQAGKWYTVGEDGTEVVSMHPGGGATVYNAKQTSQMAAWSGHTMAPMGGGGKQTMVIEHRHTIEITGREMWSGFRREVARLGGDVQLAAGSKRPA